MNEQRHRVPSTDGFTLAVRAVVPSGPRAGVVLCHGLNTGADDGGPFLPLRDLLVERGLAVFRFDARCHGDTGGSWRALSLAGWRDDVASVTGFARETIAERPLMLLAASFSGGPAIATASRRGDISALVLWNPVLDYGRTYFGDSHPAGRAIKATCGDPALPDWAECSIPWSGIPLSRELVAELNADRTARTLAGLEVPVRVFHGSSDPFVPIRLNRAIVAASAQASMRTYPLARHGFRGLRWLVRRESVRWLANRL